MRIRSLAAFLAVFVAFFVSASSASAATPGAIWGVQVNDNLPIGGGSPSYWPYVASLQTKLGRPFAGWRRNGVTGADDLAAYRKAYDGGWHWSYANGKTQTGTGKLWVDTAAGKYDSFYKNYFDTIKADPRWTTANPFHYSFHHEQYVISEGGGLQAGTAADYIAAFRHVRAIMDAENANVAEGGNMLMVWVPHVNQFYMDPVYGSHTASKAVAPFVVSKLYPGDLYVDEIGADIYRRHTSTTSAAAQWTPVHKFALDHGMSFFTGETGVDGSDSSVVAYLKQLDGLLKSWGGGTGPGQIDAILWTTRVTSTDDDRLDKSPARLAQYKAMANDPFYAGTR